MSWEQALINGKRKTLLKIMISVSVKQWWSLFFWKQDAANELVKNKEELYRVYVCVCVWCVWKLSLCL